MASFGRRPSLPGLPAPAGGFRLPHGRPTGRTTCRTPSGLSRSACVRYGRGGCPLFPGDGGAFPAGNDQPAGTCRLPAAGPLDGAKSTACMDTDPVHARPAWQVEGNASRRSHRPRERMTPVDTRSSVRWLVASATLSGRVPGSAHSPRARPSVGGRRWHRGRPGPVGGSRRRGRRPGSRRSRARRGRPGTGIGRGRRAGG
jgi:hypothetical protein